MKACHDGTGHLDDERSWDLLKNCFYWALMSTDIKHHIKNCERCLHFKVKPQKAELHPIMTMHPMQLVHIEYLTVESGKTDKEINILVVTDHFIRYVQAVITPAEIANIVAQTLWNDYFVHYGLPKNMRDQGYNFESSPISF